MNNETAKRIKDKAKILAADVADLQFSYTLIDCCLMAIENKTRFDLNDSEDVRELKNFINQIITAYIGHRSSRNDNDTTP